MNFLHLIHAACSTRISNLTIKHRNTLHPFFLLLSSILQKKTFTVFPLLNVSPRINAPSVRLLSKFLIFGINCFYARSILETAKGKLTEKLFSSDEIAGPHRPMVEISSALQTVFISISVTRKGHVEA